jgi:hypothetical protein
MTHQHSVHTALIRFSHIRLLHIWRKLDTDRKQQRLL